MMESFPWVRKLVEEKPIINPSLLAADFANLESEIRKAEEAGARVLHVDVMDGHFVPNISVGVPVVASIRKITKLPLDVHLMISEPEKYVEAFAEAGADSILFHIEVVPDPTALLTKIRGLGAAPGLVLNPGTPAEAILPFIQDADIVLTMSVQPGFGGQKFKPEVLDKVRAFKKAARPDTLLSIDGGIDKRTVKEAAEAGVDMFVAGTSVFDAEDCRERIELLRQLAREGMDESQSPPPPEGEPREDGPSENHSQ